MLEVHRLEPWSRPQTVDARLLQRPMRLPTALLSSKILHAEEPLHILERLDDHSSYFTLWTNAVNHEFSPTRSAELPYICLCTVALLTPSMITSKWGTSFTIECIEPFYRSGIECFGPEYMHRPTIDDIRCLLAKGEKGDFLVWQVKGKCDLNQLYIYWFWCLLTATTLWTN